MANPRRVWKADPISTTHLSPYRGRGPPALPGLPRRPARRRGRHPPLTDPAQDVVAFQVAVNHASPLGSRPEATSGPPRARGASPETRNPATVPSTAARLPPLPPSRLSPGIHTPPPTAQTTASPAPRRAYNPHSRGDLRFSSTGCSRTRATCPTGPPWSRSRLREQPCTFDGRAGGEGAEWFASPGGRSGSS